MRTCVGGRWVALALGSLFTLQGCYELVSKPDMKMYKEAVQANERQAKMIDELKRTTESLRKENSELAAKVREKDAYIEELSRVLKTYDKAMEKLKSYQEAVAKIMGSGAGIEGVEMVRGEEGPAFRVLGDVLFDSGQATLKKEGKAVIAKVAAELKKTDYPIRVSGFTDSDPIKHSKWDSNLELSGARAYALLKELKALGIPESRMHFAGYGASKLIMDPDGKENKAKSRRAEIMLVIPVQPSTGAVTAETK